jgi:hypothetical protein
MQFIVNDKPALLTQLAYFVSTIQSTANNLTFSVDAI